MISSDFLSRLKNVKSNGPTQWMASCPVPEHGKGNGDRNPSLSVKESDGKILLNCFCGCTNEQIIAALGLQMKDLFTEPSQKSTRRCVETYTYQNADGTPAYFMERWEPGKTQSKDFLAKTPDGKCGMNGVKPCLYHLPEVLSAKESVWLVEGERKADWLIKLGEVATSAPFGASAKWEDQYTEVLREKDIILCPDNDKPGQKKLAQWKTALTGKTASLRVVKIPEPHNDVVDFLRSVGPDTEIQRKAVFNLLSDAANMITPADNPAERFPKIRFSTLIAYKPDPSHRLAGDGWIKRKSGTLLTGGTGIGKSVLAEQIAVCATAGIPFFGIQIREPWRVLYVGAENDEETLQRDFLAIRKNVPGTVCPVLVECNLDIRRILGVAGDGFFSVLQDLTSKTNPDLLVIDPLQSYLSGGDINSSETFLEMIRGFNVLLEKSNCGLMLICHTPKPRDRDGWTSRESVYMAAGSSVLANWCRTSCELTEIPNEDRYRLRFGKNAERTGLVDDEGQVCRDLYICHSGNIKEPFWRLAQDQRKPTRGKYNKEFKEFYNNNPDASLREVAKAIGCGITTVQRWKKSQPKRSL